MKDHTVKLLEDRVVEAVARIRKLRAERDGWAAECQALRARVSEFERDGTRSRHDDLSTDLRKIRAALRDAIRELRGEDEAAGGPAGEGGPERSA